MKTCCKTCMLLITWLVTTATVAQDAQHYIKVHFLYGSKPAKQYRESEKKWFGGKMGGHVGIETTEQRVLDFVRSGKFHWIAKSHDKHGKFVIRTVEHFWRIFGASPETVKKLSITIPVTPQQKNKLDSIVYSYAAQTPYDYAFMGMRCAAATYDILGKLEIVTPYSYRKTYLKVFYPKKLRRALLKKAAEQGWNISSQEGTPRRVWEND